MYVTGVPSDHYNESVISQDNRSGYLSYSLFVGHMTVRFECVRIVKTRTNVKKFSRIVCVSLFSYQGSFALSVISDS